MYLFFPPITICLVTVIRSQCSYPPGERLRSSLLNVTLTLALVTPACPCLYTSSCKLAARTYEGDERASKRASRASVIDTHRIVHDGHRLPRASVAAGAPRSPLARVSSFSRSRVRRAEGPTRRERKRNENRRERNERRSFGRTCVRFEMPSTKQMESKMFDLPDPLSPVIALNNGSNPGTTVRLA